MGLAASASHIPVLLAPLLAAAEPLTGLWVDGTMGAGGYTRAILDKGADVVAFDRDPMAIEMSKDWALQYGSKLRVIEDRFANMADYVPHADGVVLDLGVSSMQLDQAERGFSFMQDGPLDMRMGCNDMSATDLINSADEAVLADILYLYGEERASRRIARAIVAQRKTAPITTTAGLSSLIEAQLPRAKPGASHPATRSFQAIRIAVNDEFGELVNGLDAAQRLLGEGGFLAVVSFHSLEDRIIKRYLQVQSGQSGRGNRHMPDHVEEAPVFEVASRKGVAADAAELAQNPRARSARLRMARRTGAAPCSVDPTRLGRPDVNWGRHA